jgi:hypothetical protein
MVQWKITEIITSLIEINTFYDKDLTMAMVRNFEVILEQKLDNYMYNSTILCSVMS